MEYLFLRRKRTTATSERQNFAFQGSPSGNGRGVYRKGTDIQGGLQYI